MFTYQIRHFPCTGIYLTGFCQSLNELMSSNPAWQYCIQPLTAPDEPKIHLTIVDATGCESLSDLPPLALSILIRRGTLVFVTANQHALTSTLVKDFGCSVLCVDERSFRIREIVEGTLKKKRFLSASVLHYLHTISPVEQVALTPAERSVLQYLSKGYTGVEIATSLFRSQKTISSHKRNIMRKLGAKTEIELAKVINSY
jgi:DNA-binding NarL/FixJ family response regulator